MRTTGSMTRARGKLFSAQAQNYRECVLYIEDDGTTTYGRTGEPLDSAQKAFELMRRDCMRTGATVGGNRARAPGGAAGRQGLPENHPAALRSKT